MTNSTPALTLSPAFDQLRQRIAAGDAAACWEWVQRVEQQGSAPHQLEAQARVNLLNQAAQGGVGVAAVQLGLWYAQGHYVAVDMAKAILYFELAATLGKNADGYLYLADIFQHGVGVAASESKSRQYLEKALAMQHPDAIFIHAQSLLTEQNPQIKAAWRALTENYLKRHHVRSAHFINDHPQFDQLQVEQWLLQHAEQDTFLAALLAARYWQQGDVDMALPWAQRSSQDGQTIGSYIRARMEQSRIDGDIDLAQQLMLVAAQQGHIDAAYQVGAELLKHPQHAENAVQWLAQAAQNGHAQAQFLLAQCWLEGVGVPQSNQQEALAWLERAVAQGHVDATFALALQLPHQHEQHVPLLLRAAQAGHSKAMLCVGLYHQQNGQAEQALSWFEQAQTLGDSRADYLLAMAYRDGLGVEADPKRAVELFKSAAEKGDSDGYFALYESYKEGIGVRKNKKSAAQYLALAQAAQHPHALTIAMPEENKSEQ